MAKSVTDGGYFTPKNNVEITFDANAPTGKTPTETPDQQMTPGYKATEPTTVSTCDGHVFDGWYEDKACTVKYDFNETKTKETLCVREILVFGRL